MGKWGIKNSNSEVNENYCGISVTCHYTTDESSPKTSKNVTIKTFDLYERLKLPVHLKKGMNIKIYAVGKKDECGGYLRESYINSVIYE